MQFESAKATLTPESKPILDRVVDILRRYPSYQLAIGGHTDSIGEEGPNQRLSEARAKTVNDYIIAAGIPVARVSYAGFGESMPIADNKFEAGRKQNRRVTLDLLVP
ncbi:MAG: OmpA family protein [Lewinella sp.]|nr:OmpA family protein [Lewinella sp.]